MLFRASDTDFDNRLPVARWFRRSDRYKPVLDFYIVALPRRSMFVDHQFLAFAQALEAQYNRQRQGQHYVKAAVEAAVGALPRRLRRHVPDDFPDHVRVTRNDLVHLNQVFHPNTFSGWRLDAAARALRLLFEVRLLQALGFGQRQIETLVQENQRLQAELQWGLVALKDD